MISYRAGTLRAKRLEDPQTLRIYMTIWTKRGRRLTTLARMVNVPDYVLADLATDRTHRARAGLTKTVLNIPLPPSDIGTARRTQALAVRGYTLTHIASETGATFKALANGITRREYADPVAFSIARFYTEHAHQQGPSKEVARRAARDNLAGPDAWHGLDIDLTWPWPGPTPLTLHNAWTRARELQRLPNNWGTARGLRAQEAA
jgi:hypothetical protein